MSGVEVRTSSIEGLDSLQLDRSLPGNEFVRSM